MRAGQARSIARVKAAQVPAGLRGGGRCAPGAGPAQPAVPGKSPLSSAALSALGVLGRGSPFTARGCARRPDPPQVLRQQQHGSERALPFFTCVCFLVVSLQLHSGVKPHPAPVIPGGMWLNS